MPQNHTCRKFNDQLNDEVMGFGVSSDSLDRVRMESLFGSNFPAICQRLTGRFLTLQSKAVLEMCSLSFQSECFLVFKSKQMKVLRII